MDNDRETERKLRQAESQAETLQTPSINFDDFFNDLEGTNSSAFEGQFSEDDIYDIPRPPDRNYQVKTYDRENHPCGIIQIQANYVDNAFNDSYVDDILSRKIASCLNVNKKKIGIVNKVFQGGDNYDVYFLLKVSHTDKIKTSGGKKSKKNKILNKKRKTLKLKRKKTKKTRK